MNKYLPIVTLVILVLVGILVWQAQPTQPNTSTNDWSTFTDNKLGVSFKYPATLGTAYITTQAWPPTVKVITGPLTCAVELQTYNGRSYCAKAETDGAAGSVYTTHIYSSTMPKSDKVVELSFTLRAIQCANYDEPKRTACDTERKTFNVDKLAYQMISSVMLFTPSQSSSTLGFPLDHALSRITKKPFGIYITPKTSPVQPEKFTGYHTGTDFEVFPNEADSVVSVKAIASGKVIYRKWVSGYGGVIIQTAEVNGGPVTILYGHLALDSIAVQVGDGLTVGEAIGHLGQGYSHDTDGERKHLHLGVHKGNQIVLLGYVTKSNDLSQWVDVATLW